MPNLKSKLTHIQGIAKITIRPGDNELTDKELKDVVGHKDGAFFVENAKFVVAKAPVKSTASTTDSKKNS